MSVKISQLPSDSAVDGTEQIPLVQAGVTKQGLLSTLANWILTVYKGFLQSGTGAQATNLQVKNRQWLSVFDFMTAAQIADVQAGTLLVDVSTAVSNAVTAASGALLVIEPGSYLMDGGITIAAGYKGSIWFKPNAIFYAGANSMTFFTSGTSWFSSQLITPWFNGNGKTGVVGLDLTNFRGEGAGIVRPTFKSMANGIIYRSGSYGTVLDSPYMTSVNAPIQVVSNNSTLMIRSPQIDTFTTIGIDVQTGSTHNIGVMVLGGYVQNGATGISVADIGTIVQGTYFEACTTADVSLVSGSSYFRGYATQHFGSGVVAYKGRSADGAIIRDPCMGNGNRSTGLFDFDSSNTNCRAELTYESANINAPLGTTTGVNLNVSQSFTPVVSGTSTAGTGTYTTQSGEYSVSGNRVSFSIHVTWTAHTGTGNTIVTGLPSTVGYVTFEPRRTFDVVIEGASYTGPKLTAYFDGNTTTEIAIAQVNTSGTSANIALPAAATLRITGCYDR